MRRHHLAFAGLIWLLCAGATSNVFSANAGLYEKARQETLAGLTAHEEGRFGEAASHFESALVFRPNHPGLVFTLAQVRGDEGNQTEALA